MDLVRFIKNLENEFLKENNELYLSSRNEFLRKREDFINKKLHPQDLKSSLAELL